MIRLLVVLVAALYTTMYVFGDPARRPEVSRAEPLGLNIVQASYATNDVVATALLPESVISDVEAVKIALEAGVKFRSERKTGPRLGNAIPAPEVIVAKATSEHVVDQATATKSFWYVTGGRVNLRQGPGTSNAVIGSVKLGDAAEVLDDQDGWYQIRTADGALSGWIFGKFLGEQRPS